MWIPDNSVSGITFNHKTMKWHSIRLQEIEFYIQFEFLHTTYYAVSSFVRFLSGPYIFCKVIYTHVTCYKLWFSTIFFTGSLRYFLTANSIIYNAIVTRLFPFLKLLLANLLTFWSFIDFFANGEKYFLTFPACC